MKPTLPSILAALLLATLSGTALASTPPPQLVKDIYTGITAAGSNPFYIRAVENTVFFTADDGMHGSELWKSDGSATGTALVKDILPGAVGSLPSPVVALGNSIYFTANSYNDSGSAVKNLWKSNLTSGVTEMVKDVAMGYGSADPQDLTVIGDTLYFSAYNGIARSLWKSDGSTNGTVLIKSLASGAPLNPEKFFPVGGILFFRASDATHGTELWKSDGTSGGTVMVKDIYPGTFSGDLINPVELGGWLYFTANDGTHGQDLWKSDGTLANTVMVKDIRVGPNSPSMGPPVKCNGLLYFVANDGTHGQELWESDGSAGGTTMVKDINNGGSGILSQYQQLVPMGDHLYFAANDGSNGLQLWKTDGTDAGTVMVKNGSAGALSPQNLIAAGSRLYFTANTAASGSELWTSDGSATGTYLVKDIFPGSDNADPAGLCEAGGVVYFRASDGVHGTELWRTDGSETNTVMVKDILSVGASSSPSQFTAAAGQAFFVADDGVHGPEWWTSNGTATGTLVAVDNRIYFTASDGNNSGLWRSDGTAAGTVMLKVSTTAVPTNLTALSSSLYFTLSYQAWDTPPWSMSPVITATTELWKSDGTVAGTVLVTSDQIISDPFSSPGGMYTEEFSNLTPVGNTLYLTGFKSAGPSVFNSSYGSSLWKVNATTGGAERIWGPSGNSNLNQQPSIGSLTAMGSTLYFQAPGTPDPYSGTQTYALWKCDGTNAGPTLVKENISSSYGYGTMVPLGKELYFGGDNNTLWQSDGTGTGTLPMSGPFNSIPSGVTRVGGKQYFIGSHASYGSELWRTDGTDVGTFMLKDIHNGVAGSNPQSLTPVGDALYFLADDGIHGAEIWKSDGTEAGTRRLADIAGGPAFTSYGGLLAVGTQLYFTAATPGSGSELYVYETTHVAPMIAVEQPAGTSLSTGGAMDFGSVITGTSTYLTFTIKNTGTADLILGTIIKDGTNAAEFSLTAPAVTTLGAGASSTFGVQFLPGSAGAKTAALHIVGNDADGSPFDIVLSGLGAVSSPPIRLVKDICSGIAGAGSNPSFFRANGNTGFFTADDGMHGHELWKSDGTAAGTVLVKDILSGSGASGASNLMTIGNRVFFTATDGVNGIGLWRSDGTTAGTVMLKTGNPAIPTNLTAVGGLLYFTLSYQTLDTPVWSASTVTTATAELWKSDGTVPGTVLVTSDQIMSDPYSSSGGMYVADFSNLTPLGNTLYFTEFKSTGSSGFNPSNASSLWSVDASTGGASKIRQFSWYSNQYQYQQMPTIGGLIEMGSALYFQAPGTPDPSSGTPTNALWRSDGTNAGTTLVKENIRSFLGGGAMVALANQLYFTGDNNTLWKSDGSETGTLPATGPFNNLPYGVTQVGSKLYFQADDGTHGYELWVSDGTDAGTVMVKDICNGPAGSNPQNLTPLGDVLYFLADDGIHGTEIWKSDGTAAGTLRLREIAAGPVFTSYGGLLAVGTKLLFSAATPDYGSELYVYEAAQVAPNIAVEQPAGTSLSTGATKDFGSVLVGSSSALTFTIYNTGTAVLVLGTITKDGSNAADFSVAAPAVTTLATGTSTTFGVQFLPGSTGVKTAALHIASNVSGAGNPFDIALNGTGATPSAMFGNFISDHSGLSGLAATPTAIPFNDGVSNLLKYAFNLNLAGPDDHILSAATGTAGLPLITLSGSGAATQINLEFLRRKNSGLIYTPKYATDLTTFAPTTGTTTVTPIDSEWERVVVQQPASPATMPRCFGRVEVTLP